MQNRTNKAAAAAAAAVAVAFQPKTFNDFFSHDVAEEIKLDHLNQLASELIMVEEANQSLLENIFTLSLALSGYNNENASKSNMTDSMWKTCRYYIMVSCGVIDADKNRLLPEGMKHRAESYFAPFKRSVEDGKPDYAWVHGMNKCFKEYASGAGKKGHKKEDTAAAAESTDTAAESTDTAAAESTNYAAIIEQLTKERDALKVQLAIVEQQRDALTVKCNALELAANKAASIQAKRVAKANQAAAH